MRYIQRDRDGIVTGHFANPQPYATEEVVENHPDIQAFQEKRERFRSEYIERKILIATTMTPEILMQKIVALEKRVDELENQIIALKGI